ncbi:YheE family protein [Bacillus sp. S/N-304-OC-R1]|uniref:YheE family protein n=1 Tax=Bacillus sp. S/N-304-OC-R1 TaxID=2758034 RepID=UPI001C8EBC56|nr:YheE family protein [Bacillus sp. S/N-304-OC-R1]MBY0123101.1 YheE family protein [Bacillus sp. S/N-304-OC-R1]
MLTHFQYKPLYENKQLPGWKISFYYNKQKFNGIYHQNGKIEWTSTAPYREDEMMLMEQIHELMLFHVYDQ